MLFEELLAKLRLCYCEVLVVKESVAMLHLHEHLFFLLIVFVGQLSKF